MQAPFFPTFHRPSSFLRSALAVYIFLIIYASLYPFEDWHFAGVYPLAYVTAPFPRYWTGFDVLVNIIGYMPLGFLLVTAIAPLLRTVKAFAFAFCSGTFLSFCMEALQTFLPSRVPSNLDLLTNAGGVLLGAALGLIFSPVIFKNDRMYFFIRSQLRIPSSRALILPLLWPLAQIYPQSDLFGLGEVSSIFSTWLSALLDKPVNLALSLEDIQLTIGQYWLSETVITAAGFAGAVLLLLHMLHDRKLGLFLAAGMTGCALVLKTLASALFFAPKNAFIWLTPGALAGLAMGLVLVTALAFASHQFQQTAACCLLCVALAAVNVMPGNHYFVSTLQTWSQGKFLNFNGAARFLALVWPFAALFFLMRSIYKRRQSE